MNPVAVIAWAIVAVVIALFAWLLKDDIKARWDRLIQCRHDQPVAVEVIDAWNICADPPCDPEDFFNCRAHCPNCTDISPCIGHDQAWAREWERRLQQS